MLPYLDDNHKIPSYGIMMALGISICFLLNIFFNKDSVVKKDDRMYSACFGLIGGILGAKILAILISIPYIKEYNLSIFDIIKNGFVFYGGLIGGAAGLFIYARMFKIKVADIFDCAALVLPMGQVFGRIGCFLAGCCFGHPTESIFGVTYTISADPTTPLGVSILPTQLFESAYCLLIFIALQIVSLKKRRSGMLTVIYALSYSVCRFINEFFRYDATRGFLLGLSTSQIISIVVFALASAFLIITFMKNKNIAKTQIETPSDS